MNYYGVNFYYPTMDVMAENEKEAIDLAYQKMTVSDIKVNSETGKISVEFSNLKVSVEEVTVDSVEEKFNTNEYSVFNSDVNENYMSFVNDNLRRKIKAQFVHNLGVLASQTREQISEMYLDNNDLDTVIIVYNNGYTQEVNIAYDSFSAIVRDVFKSIEL